MVRLDVGFIFFSYILGILLFYVDIKNGKISCDFIYELKSVPFMARLDVGFIFFCFILFILLFYVDIKNGKIPCDLIC